MKSNIFAGIIIFAGIFFLGGCEEDLFDMFGDPRDRITGEWKVEEDSEIFKKKDTNRFYSVNITKDPNDSTVIYIDGFYELSGKVKVNMNGYTLSIPDQTLDGFTITEGSGSVSFNYKSMTFYYYVSFTGERDVVRADYTRPVD